MSSSDEPVSHPSKLYTLHYVKFCVFVQDVLFGNFSEEDVGDLFKNTTSDLHFVWQEKAAPKRCALFGKILVVQTATSADQGGYSPGALSPNIPPNPPSSPVEGNNEALNRGLLSKLNVNAMPFVPGTLSAVGPVPESSVDVTKNDAVRQLNFPTSDGGSECTVSSDTHTSTEYRHQLPGVVVQTIGEPSCGTQTLESNSRVDESDYHPREQSTNSTDQQTSENHSINHELSKSPPAVDPSNTQSSDPHNPTAQSHFPASDNALAVRQRDVSPQTKPPHSSHSRETSSKDSRSRSRSPTPTPLSPHRTTSPKHTLTSSQNTLSSSQASSTTQVESKRATSPQGAPQQLSPVHVTQTGSRPTSPGSVTSFSTVPSAAGSSASGGGGEVKVKSWASVVGKKSNDTGAQVSQASSQRVPSGHSVPGGGLVTTCNSRGDGTASHDQTAGVVTATGSRQSGQPQLPHMNPVQLTELGSMFYFSAPKIILFISPPHAPTPHPPSPTRANDDVEDKPRPCQYSATGSYQPGQLVLHARRILSYGDSLYTNTCTCFGP